MSTGHAAAAIADLSDEEVVERVLSGDRASYEILMRRYNLRVYRAVRAILHDESEIEDVMQEAYFAAYRKLANFAGRARFSTWLIRIAINRALDRLRRAGRFVPFDPTLERAPLHASCLPRAMDGHDPERQIGALELVRRLEAAIEALPEPYRAAFMLRVVAGMEIREAAECLHVEEGTVKTRIHRARRLLREALGREVGDTESEVFRFGGERCDRVVAAVLRGIA